MQVREIMTQNPYCVQAGENVQRAAQEMKTHNVGVLPVCEGDNLIGIITDRDIVLECVAAGHTVNQCRVREHMTANPITIAPGASAEDALQMMAREQIRRLCVTEGNRVQGILSLGDLAVHMSGNQAVAQTLAAISEPVRAGQPGRPGG
ncbi:MAG TPA: CBS domain-containing protein [Dehalococcoidia bacterium]